jgi:hypothetical protein
MLGSRNATMRLRASAHRPNCAPKGGAGVPIANATRRRGVRRNSKKEQAPAPTDEARRLREPANRTKAQRKAK